MELDKSTDPIAFFKGWLAEAARNDPNNPDAMALATVGADGAPSVRMVLLKDVSPAGFVFYTNMESRKGREISGNPHVAACFYWRPSQRQVRVEGRVETVPAPMADAYFKTRHYLSRLGAWASRQSRPLKSRAELEQKVEELKGQYPDQEVPRPPNWSGYRIVPERIEFWQQGDFRLHDRFLFTKAADGWDVERLSP